MEVPNSLSLKEIISRWENLHSNHSALSELGQDLYDSWQDDYAGNIDRYRKKLDNIVPHPVFRESYEKSRHLVDCALPVIENLSYYLENKGFLVILTNQNLMVVKVAGDKAVADWAESVGIVEGSMWSAELAGTNAGSLGMKLKKPVSLFAYEHFCLSSVSSTATGCPIIESGHVLGGLGIVGPYSSFNDKNHLGMIDVSAQQICSSMFLSRMNKYQRAILDSMSDGVMVIDLKGHVAFINQECLNILSIGSAVEVIGRKLEDVLGGGKDNTYFLDSVSQEKLLTDELFVITRGKIKIKCTVTCTPVRSTDKYEQGNVLIFRRDERSNHLVKKWFGRSAKMSFDNVIGEDSNFVEILKIAKSAALSDSNVLLLGESGTGKDVIAQAMHNESLRRNNPFVAINCASLPRELLVSELFGYEEGAFTGAKKGGNIGKFELANQGTIFLDEIGEMPMDLQVMLLRAIEEKSIIRLGDTKMTPVNIRIISATNKDLEHEIGRKTFRLDLFYRLGVMRLKLPALRDRGDDVMLLAEHFIRNICGRYSKPVKVLHPEARDAVMAYSWPGNIRELQNVLESMVFLSDGDEITPDKLKGYIPVSDQPAAAPAVPSVRQREARPDERRSLSEIEDELIGSHLSEGRYSIDELAELLGTSRRTIYRRISSYKSRIR